MNSSEILRIVDAIHRDKNISSEIVFEGIEQAILTAARRHFGENAELVVDIDRESGEPSVSADGEPLTPEEIGELGRIAAQTAKQVIIQKIREAERDALFDEFSAIRSHLVTGTVSRVEGSICLVNLGKVEAMLPRSEQIPGEYHRVNERVRAIVLDVRKAGSRVKVILSRCHPDLVRRLFEVEIPEVAEQVIEVRSLAREAGYRSKVAVSCFDSKIDCVGACVGVRGQRIRGVIDELAGERIDIVRWNDSLQVLVPNALQPAEVEDVILCPMLGKVIVLVRDDQLSLAIGKKGQNVRLASKLVGWDIQVMTQERLGELLDQAVTAFGDVPHIDEDLAEKLVAQGFFTFDDLSVIEPDQLAAMGELTEEQCDEIVARADEESLRIEQEERETRQRDRAARRVAAEIEELSAQRSTAEPAPATDEKAVDPAELAAASADAVAEADAVESAATEEPAATGTEESAAAEEPASSSTSEPAAPADEEPVPADSASQTETVPSAEATTDSADTKSADREDEVLTDSTATDVESENDESEPGQEEVGEISPADVAAEENGKPEEESVKLPAHSTDGTSTED
ncbi:MAG: transcription termination factor NusA [Planctomycetaceae bacterium]|nr:transcription termination factor NusA [Planctomycetaceae bacterium]